MKKYVLLVVQIIIIIIIFTVGCSRNNTNQTPITSMPTSSVISPSLQPNVSSENQIAPIVSDVNDYKSIGKTLADGCLAYMFGGRGHTPDDFVNILGEPIKKDLGRWYFKQDIQIDVFGDAWEIGNYVYIGVNCQLRTDRDIGVGSTYDEVSEIYKNEINPEQTNQDLITVGDKHDGIFFVIKEEKVFSIYISTGGVTPEYSGYFSPDRP